MGARSGGLASLEFDDIAPPSGTGDEHICASLPGSPRLRQPGHVFGVVEDSPLPTAVDGEWKGVEVCVEIRFSCPVLGMGVDQQQGPCRGRVRVGLPPLSGALSDRDFFDRIHHLHDHLGHGPEAGFRIVLHGHGYLTGEGDDQFLGSQEGFLALGEALPIEVTTFTEVLDERLGRKTLTTPSDLPPNVRIEQR